MLRHLQVMHPVTCVLVVMSCALLTFVGLRQTLGDVTAGSASSQPQPKAVRNLAGEQPKPPLDDPRPAGKRVTRAQAEADPLKVEARRARRRARRLLANLSEHAPPVVGHRTRPGARAPVTTRPPAGAGPGGTTPAPAPSATPKQAPAPQAPGGTPTSTVPSQQPTQAPAKTTPAPAKTTPVPSTGGTSATGAGH